MPDATVWRRSADVAFVDSEERTALLDLRALEKPPLILQGPSAVIWQALGESAAEDELLTRVAAHYGLDPEDVRDDTIAFLHQLAELGLADSGTAEPPTEEA